MYVPVTAKAALFQVLLEGKGFGVELAERVSTRTKGKIKLGQGSLYPALKSFEEDGLVTSYDEEGKKNQDHTGRPRIYYALTQKGRRAALAQRDMLARLIGLEISDPKLKAEAKEAVESDA